MLFKKEFKIGSINVGGDSKCIIIAEVSANHNNDYKIIKKLLNSAKKKWCRFSKNSILYCRDLDN